MGILYVTSKPEKDVCFVQSITFQHQQILLAHCINSWVIAIKKDVATCHKLIQLLQGMATVKAQKTEYYITLTGASFERRRGRKGIKLGAPSQFRHVVYFFTLSVLPIFCRSLMELI